MTDLTDKWKKGELPSGWYWVELKEGTFVDGKKSIILDYLFEFTNDFERHPYLIEQVLAPVPSYEKWDKLNNACHELEKETACLTVDIVKLKELLKECRTYISEWDTPMDILARIDEVLGE